MGMHGSCSSPTDHLLPPLGDIATFPIPFREGVVRIEHWAVAQNHGRAAARSIAGQPAPYEKVPFFWTVSDFQEGEGGKGEVVHGILRMLP